MPKDSEQSPDSETAKAVHRLTVVIILLVGLIVCFLVIQNSMASFDKAKDEGNKDAVEFCVDNAIEHNIGTDYCYDE